MGYRNVLALTVSLAALAAVCHGQQIISAQSGTIHYTEGKVTVDGRAVVHKNSEFTVLKQGQELETQNGRAELLLTPGAFLRVDENSAVRLLDSRLSDTRIQVVSGSAIVECDELLKDNAISLVQGNKTIRLEKHGLYRVDASPAMLRVYDGTAVVEAGDERVAFGRGKETSLDSVLVAEKFNRKSADGFSVWAADRSAYVASASVYASQSVLNNHNSWKSSGWYFSPFYDMYTFLPANGFAYSPYGWGFWSPAYMSLYYVPNGYGYGGGVYNGRSGSTIDGGVTGRSGGFGSAGGSGIGSGGFGGGGIVSGGGARGAGGGGGISSHGASGGGNAGRR